MGRPGFSFLICPDSALLKEELERQLGPDGAVFKRCVFWGDEEPGPNFWESLQQVGLFAEKRAVIVRQAQSWVAAIWKELSLALARRMDHVWPFFCLEVEFDKGKPKIPTHIQKTDCFAWAEKKGWIWKSPGLGQGLAAYARAHAKKLGLNFSPQDFTTFCASVQPDAQSVLNELLKLSLLAENGQVQTRHLPEGEAALEEDAFALIRAIVAGDLAAVWARLSNDSEGGTLFFLIALLARDFRMLWQICAGENPRMHPAEAKRKSQMATALGQTGIARGFAALAEAEWRVKSGKMRPDQALESLCAEMAGLFRGRK